tara:strand:- start:40 stop:978 length:939 start_codon:yes stop_codon:yes gene_type:complete
MIASLGARAQDLSPKVQDMINIAVMPNGFVTEEMHKQFWEEINKSAEPNETEQIRLGNQVILLALEYQKELLSSARMSYLKGSASKNQRMIEIETDTLVVFKKLTALLPLVERTVARGKFKNEFSLVQQQAIELLSGIKTESDLKFANKTLSVVTPQFERLTTLLNSEWKAIELIYLTTTASFHLQRPENSERKIFLEINKTHRRVTTFLPNYKVQDYLEEVHTLNMTEFDISFKTLDGLTQCGNLNRTTLVLGLNTRCFSMSKSDAEYRSIDYNMEILDAKTFKSQKLNYMKNYMKKRITQEKEKLDARKL